MSFGSAALAQLVGLAANAALSIFLAISLSPEGFGDFALATAIGLFAASIAIRGYDTLTMRMIASRTATCVEEDLQAYLAHVRLRAIIDGSVTGVIVVIAAMAAVTLGAIPSAMALTATALRIPFVCLQRIDEGALRGLNSLAWGLASLWLIPALALGLILCIPAGYLSAATAVQAHLIATAATCVVRAAALKRIASSLRASTPTQHVTQFQRRQWAQQAKPFALLTITMAAQSQSGILIAGLMLGSEGAGLYGIASRLMLPLLIVVEAVSLVISPKIAATHAAGDHRALQRLLSQASWIVFPATTLLVIGIWISAEPVLACLGPGYEAASTALKILSLGPLVHVACGPVAQSLNMTGHGWVTLRGVVGGLIISLVLSVSLAPWLGVNGIAIGAATGLSTWSIGLTVAVRRLLAVNSSFLPWKRQDVATHSFGSHSLHESPAERAAA